MSQLQRAPFPPLPHPQLSRATAPQYAQSVPSPPPQASRATAPQYTQTPPSPYSVSLQPPASHSTPPQCTHPCCFVS